MAVRKIIRMGHPTLRKPARRLEARELKSPEIGRLVNDMIDTLNDAGGIGLAAPQIDEPVRLAIIEIDGGQSRYGEIPAMPLTVFVNPTIEIVDPKAAGYWEGCLSVPGLRGWVERPQFVRVSYQDLDGKKHAIELKGFLATVFQHEFDHLDGKLYIDRMTDPTKLVFEEEYLRYLSADE
ncbi:MAG TPA: peptide deformylase [Pseudomonadales bacterium]|jgi:peptide deformylase|nr:peptide deformylase [Pseudomonadales bacterium]